MSQARLTKLRAMLAAREGHTCFADNCKAIRAEIERLEGMLKA